MQKLFETYNNYKSRSVQAVEILKTNARLEQQQHDLLLCDSAKSSQLIASGPQSESSTSATSSSTSTPVDTLEKLASLADKRNEILIHKLETYRDFLDKKSLNKHTSDLFHSSTTSILIQKPQRDSLETLKEFELAELDLVDQYFSMNSILLVPFKFLINTRGLDLDLKNLIIVSLCELVECSSYKIKSSWNCIFNCLNKLDFNHSNFNLKLKSHVKYNNTIKKLKFLSATIRLSLIQTKNQDIFDIIVVS